MMSSYRTIIFAAVCACALVALPLSCALLLIVLASLITMPHIICSSKTILLLALCTGVMVYLLLHATRSAKNTTGSYGLGISLTMHHGTISIRNRDGSFEDLGRIDGDDKYLLMMRRLALPSAQHLS